MICSLDLISPESDRMYKGPIKSRPLFTKGTLAATQNEGSGGGGGGGGWHITEGGVDPFICETFSDKDLVF